ncbi:ferric anguibactin-binding protein [Motilimonas pumila]|uniref:Ferric anguibactin-binding protein n=2 Tax=Motilimonas pumila TaxID=2303987 RepID=A0A418YB56_9GAMM|nr:ferric anguibactin-binding protein [Motilimonas pumila]
MFLCVMLFSASHGAVASGNDNSVTVTHIAGKTEIQTMPKRVVVLGNAGLDILDRFGIKPVGALHSLLPAYLTKYKAETTHTGSFHEPDYETIYQLKPDLIIAENRMIHLYEDISEIAPTVVLYVDNGQYWQDTEHNWRMLAKIFNKQTEVEAKIATITGQFEAIAKQAKGQNLRAIMVMSSGSKVSIYNKGSRFSVLFDEFGFSEAKTNYVNPIRGIHGNLISFEYIANAKPDVIFLLDREQAVGIGQGKAQAKFDNPMINGTPAAKNGKIIMLDPNAWYLTGGGMTATEHMIADVQQVFVP